MLTLTTEQMRRVEALANQSGLSYAQMMENAGTMAYKYLEMRYGAASKRCMVLAGAGGNGGDGFVVARRLFEAGGNPVVAICCSEPQSSPALEQYRALLDMGVAVVDLAAGAELIYGYLQSAQIIVDAVFGIGFHGAVEEPLAEVFRRANQSPAARVSLDVPSGMDADTGASGEVCVRADVTLTFATYKPAHQNVVSKELCGRIEALDIGIPAEVVFTAANDVADVGEELVKSLLPPRAPDSHKGNYGRLLVLAGSDRMAGAAMMSTLAALRMGAGVTTLAAPASVARRVGLALMEAMTLPLAEDSDGALSESCLPALTQAAAAATACLAGCGLSVTPGVQRSIGELAEAAPCPLVFDADALNCISADPSPLGRCRRIPVVTPHIGEMARLCDMTAEQIVANAVSVAKLFAKEQNCVVVLKGHRTLIATPAGEVWRNTTGNAGLAKGGSGDVLAGMVASLAAQGLSGKHAALCAVYLHGLAADRLAARMSQYGILARDLVDELPATLKSLGL